MTRPHVQSYVFADTGEGTGHHAELVTHLAAVLDPFTTSRLAPLVRAGASCLEIGAGAGTIALWMAERGAQVVATDTEPGHIPHHPNLTVRRHDIAIDPLEDARYDVIHARLVLAHQQTREQILATMVTALVPGGVVVVDEFAAGGWQRCVLDAPDRAAAQRLFDRYHEALVTVMRQAGTDVDWGRNAHRTMRAAGLADVRAAFGGALSWQGGQAGCLLPYAMTAQMRPQLLQAGLSEPDLDEFRQLLLDPRLVIHTPIAVSTAGRRP